MSFKKEMGVAGDGRERVVVLGSGWAGYRLLQDLDPNKYQVMVVSPRNHFLFTPLLASSAVGGSEIGSICQSIRPLAAKRKARFYEAKAVDLQKHAKMLKCETLDGREFPLFYDKLIIAIGFQANDFGIPGIFFILLSRADLSASVVQFLVSTCVINHTHISIANQQSSLGGKEDGQHTYVYPKPVATML